MIEQDIGNGKSVIQLAVTDKRHGADDTDALFPDVLSVPGQVIQERPVFVQQPFAQQGIAGQIHQVPVIDPVGMRQIEFNASLTEGRIFFGVGEDLDQGQQSRQPDLVIRTRDTGFQVPETAGTPAGFHHAARHGHLDTQKLVPFPILSRPGLEKPGKPLHLGGVGMGQHFCQKHIIHGSLPRRFAQTASARSLHRG